MAFSDYKSYLNTKIFYSEICKLKNYIDIDISNKYDKSGGPINGDVTILGDLDMSCNNITNINSLSFCDNKQVTLDGKSILYINTPSIIPSNDEIILPLSNGNFRLNQLNLSINSNIISPPIDISNQFIEIYANFYVDVNTNNSTGFSFDISGVDGNFYQTIDVRGFTKSGLYNVSFGPHLFLPEEWNFTSQFVFKLINNSNHDITVKTTKVIFRNTNIL